MLIQLPTRGRLLYTIRTFRLRKFIRTLWTGQSIQLPNNIYQKLNASRSVTFHGDLILSKALHEGCIVLWQIKGFDSTSSPPPQNSAPTKYDIEPDTRSAFCPPPSASDRSRQYIRLLQFAIPDCFEFYM